jgi:hypothetical protein
MRYELWHIGLANLMDDIEDEAEALAVARSYLTPNEDGNAVDVAETVYDDSGPEPRSLHGAELASLVFGPSQDQARQSA